jgi:hypothetical protein
MLSLLVLVNLGSIAGFIVGLINPHWVLIRQKRTRLKSCSVYLGAWLISGYAIGVNAPRKEPLPVVQTVVTAKPLPTSTPTTTPKPSVEAIATTPTTLEATPTPTPTPIIENSTDAFDPAVCSTPAYLPVNGASIALYTVCQLIQTDTLKPESVYLIPVSELEDWVAEAGYEKHTWKELSTVLDNKTDTCIVYKDESISCLKFSKEPDIEPVQSDNTSTPSGSTCADFSSQSDAQAALATNPRLDGNSDDVACESYFNNGGSGSHTRTRSHRHRKR